MGVAPLLSKVGGVIAYVRPPVLVEEFVGADGLVIPYGQRWLDNGRDGPDDTYSVTVHPQRFQPLVDVARVLMEHLVATYDVQRTDSGDQTVLLRPQDPTAAQMQFVFEPTPMVRITAGVSSSVAWFCSCDHCDEDVVVAIDTLEQAVAAVVDGGFSEWLNDPEQGYAGTGLFQAHALRSADGKIDQSGSASVDMDLRRQELRRLYADVPPTWSPWVLRNR